MMQTKQLCKTEQSYQTKQLYYEDTYLKHFTAKVVSCEKNGEQYEVILDQTAFYPEGGGQPSDQGTLGETKVWDVQLLDGQICHITKEPLTVGERVEGRIDWDRRFALMQQHSGEHIVSGLIHGKYGYDNVGFHMGSECITIDFNGMLTWEELVEIEKEANRYLWSDQETCVSILKGEEKSQRQYRSKKELTEDVRLVEFPGADCCACCGLHVSRTGEIGLIKILSVKKFRDGVRIEMMCGSQAMDYLRVQEEQNRKIAVALSVKPHETFQSVGRLSGEVYELKGKLMAVKEEKFRKEAQFIPEEKDVIILESNLSPTDLRKCADIFLEQCKGICAVISGDDRTGYKYAIGKRNGDIRNLVKELNKSLNGRGGGKPEFAQGSFSGSKEEILSCFSAMGFWIM